MSYAWAMPRRRSCPRFLELNLSPGKPLIRTLGIAPSKDAPASAILRHVDPITILTIGKRDLKRRRGWTIFFDKVHKKPHTTHLAVLDLKAARVVSNRQALFDEIRVFILVARWSYPVNLEPRLNMCLNGR